MPAGHAGGKSGGWSMVVDHGADPPLALTLSYWAPRYDLELLNQQVVLGLSLGQGLHTVRGR